MKKIIFVGYPAPYFFQLSKILESNNYLIFWITALNSDYEFLIKKGITPEKVCNVSGSKFHYDDNNYQFLKEIECEQRPYFNDIILMDRNLREINQIKSKSYLNFVAKESYNFIKMVNPDLISSWRDTSVQLVVLKIAKKFEYNYVIPTRYRLPKEFYGFCIDFETNSFLKFNNIDKKDVEWAIQTYNNISNIKPELKVSARRFIDVFKLIPSHSKAFINLVKKLYYDFGNKYNRYSIDQIISMYIKRRIRLLVYKLFSPATIKINLNVDYIFFPLHTQPESSIDVQASIYSNQLEFVKSICRILPVSKKLYVKVHPTDVDGQPLSFFKDLANIPGVVLVDYNYPSADLINFASCIITMTGTAGMEAALQGRPVITFSNNFYNEFPTVIQAKGFENLQELLKEKSLENLKNAFNKNDIIAVLAKWKANGFFGEVSRAYGSNPRRLNEIDMNNLVDTYNQLIKCL